MPLNYDPLKSFDIDPFKYLSNSYTPPDPFASVNKQLKAVGLDPLSLDAPSQQAVGVPSAHTALDDLAPEQLEEAKEKAGGGLLSGLAWVGRKIDSVTGARAIRGALGGKYREILSAGPLGLASDEFGITKPEDIVYGRELLEKGGMLGPNKPGLDWGDVAGFGADVLLDPSTYFFGLGLATKGARAATQAGKHFDKIGKLEDILRFAGTKKGAEALRLGKPMGMRQAGMNITPSKIFAAEADNMLDDVLGMPGLRHKEGLVGELADAGVDISRVMNQPLTSPMHVGLPDFISNLGFGPLRPLKGLRRRAVNLQPGGKMETWAELMDKIGSSVRWSAPGRHLARLFDPRLRKTEAGTRVPVTRVAQQARLKEYRFMERTAQQIHRAGYEIGQKWDAMPHFQAQKILDDTTAYKNINTIEDAERMVRRNFDEVNAHMEGYQLTGEGAMRLPDWNPEVVSRIESSYGKALETSGKELKGLLAERVTAEAALRKAAKEFGGAADPWNIKAVGLARAKVDDLTKEIDTLRQLRNKDGRLLSSVRSNPANQSAIGRAIHGTKQEHFLQEGLQIQGGVSRAKEGIRQQARLSPHLREVEGDLAEMAKKYQDAFDYARRRGVDIEALKDNYAFFTPRMLFRVPETTPKGVQSMAAMGRSYANYGTAHQMQRAEGMTGWFGGTNFINRLSRKEQYTGLINAGMTAGDTQTIVNDVARAILRDEIPEMIRVGGDDARRAYQALGILDDNFNLIRNKKGEVIAHMNPHVQGLARFLAELDGRILEIGATAFEQNPIVAMMGYYVDVVRAGHATELATQMIGAHAKFGARFVESGLVGSHENVDAMMGGWGKADRGAQPIIRIRAMRDLSELNENWDEIYSFIASNDGFSVLQGNIDEIVGGNLGSVISKFAKVDDKLSSQVSRQISRVLKELKLPNDLAADVSRYVRSFTHPESMSEWAQGFDRMTDMLKSSFTTPWPAFHFRNFLSGQVNNYYIGAYDPYRWGPRKYWQPVWDARDLLRGRSIKGVANQIPMFKGGKNIPDWAKADPDKYVSDWIRSQARAYDIIGPHHTREHLTAAAELETKYDVLRSRFIEEVPGERTLGQRWRDIKGSDRPWYRKFMGGAREVGHEVEGYNRLSPMIAFLKQGFSLDEAAKKVKLAQVDYSMLTDFEKNVMRRIIPFYTFTRRQIPFVIEQLADPSSKMAQTVKGISRIKDQMDDVEKPTPDWISSDFAIPLPGGAEGQQRYLTRAGGLLGGMEDVFSLLKPGRTAMGATRRSLAGIASRMHPLLQAPIELATGQSLFLQRPLSETKPATARLIGGITGAEKVPSFPGPLTESVISRLPFFGRGVSTLRSLTDPRRPLTVDGEVSALNVAARMLPSIMGVRISEVNMDRIKNRIMQEAIEEHLKHNTSIKTFKHIYVPEAELANMDEESRALYLLYKQISSEAAKAARARKKEQSQAAAYSM